MRISTRVGSAVLAALLWLSPASAAAETLDLIGTWFVLIHYRDSMTANPDADRWEDKVWKIEKKGSRLQWTEYPIVVFSDGSGRFGRVGGNARARLLRKWEPNESQMAEILDGPQVNSRGSKTKSLRGSPKRGYKSTSARRSTSALTVGYQETWSIDDPTGLPVFTRDDALGTEAALATESDAVVSGRTRYATLEVQGGGDVLEGSYARDENKKGSFRLIRAGAARGIESDGRSPNDRQFENAMQAARDAGYGEFLRTLGDERVRELRDTVGEEKLGALWEKYARRIIAGDESAQDELGKELGDAYADGLRDQFVKSIGAGTTDAFFEKRRQRGPESAALVEQTRKVVTDERIAEIEAEYGEGIRAEDPKAIAAAGEAVQKAFEDAVRAEFVRRLEQGDAEAMRQYQEHRRKERDRR